MHVLVFVAAAFIGGGDGDFHLREELMNPVFHSGFHVRVGGRLAAGDVVIFSQCLNPIRHAALLMPDENGALCILSAEKGSAQVAAGVQLFPAELYIRSMIASGWRVRVRKLRAPIDAHQSALLTQFAALQTGKRYADVRHVVLAPFRFSARAAGLGDAERRAHEQQSWFCAELTVAAYQYAGIAAPWVSPEAVTPLNLLQARRGAPWGPPHEYRLWNTATRQFVVDWRDMLR